MLDLLRGLQEDLARQRAEQSRDSAELRRLILEQAARANAHYSRVDAGRSDVEALAGEVQRLADRLAEAAMRGGLMVGAQRTEELDGWDRGGSSGGRQDGWAMWRGRGDAHHEELEENGGLEELTVGAVNEPREVRDDGSGAGGGGGGRRREDVDAERGRGTTATGEVEGELAVLHQGFVDASGAPGANTVQRLKVKRGYLSQVQGQCKRWGSEEKGEGGGEGVGQIGVGNRRGRTLTSVDRVHAVMCRTGWRVRVRDS